MNTLCRRRLVAVAAGLVGALALIVSAHGEVNVERLDGAKVTRLIVDAGDGSVTQGTVATGSLGPAVLYDSAPSGYISGCWDHICTVGLADEMRFVNMPLDGGELTSYTFSYAAGYGFVYEYCIPGDPAGGDCDCYCPTGGECDEGDPPYTITAALYDGPPGFCGGGLPITGTEVEIATTASRPLGDELIEVTVHLDPKVFVPSEVWGVVTFDIEDAWLSIGTEPTVGSTYHDGALWEDIDADGCMDEWECWTDPYPWSCPGCTGWMHFEARANAEVEFSLVPVPPPPDSEWADLYTYRIDGNEVVLAKGGEPVWMELWVTDFDPDQTGVLLRSWQASIGSSGFSSGLQGTLGIPRCTDQSECTALDPATTCDIPSECTDVYPGFTCPQCEALGYPCTCTFGYIDNGRTDYIFVGQMELIAVGMHESDYCFASVLMGSPITSPGRESYLGTMMLWVPDDAKGTFTIGYGESCRTTMGDDDGHFLNFIGLRPATITVETGACCFGMGARDKKQGCIQDVTANQCENVGRCKGYCQDDPGVRCRSDLECELEGVSGFCIGGDTLGQICAPLSKPFGKEMECDTAAGETCVVQGVNLFSPGSVCTGDPCADCGTCASDLDCDDGNACTEDICDVEITCTCSHTPGYDTDTECCDPDTGEIEPLDDSDPCTLLGICDPTTGEVTRPPAPAGSACEDGDECTTDDQCDGAGACVGDPIAGRPCTADAQCAPGGCVDGVCECPWIHVAVPAISVWGVVVIALLVAVFAKVYFGRQRRTQA